MGPLVAPPKEFAHSHLQRGHPVRRIFKGFVNGQHQWADRLPHRKRKVGIKLQSIAQIYKTFHRKERQRVDDRHYKAVRCFHD